MAGVTCRYIYGVIRGREMAQNYHVHLCKGHDPPGLPNDDSRSKRGEWGPKMDHTILEQPLIHYFLSQIYINVIGNSNFEMFL